jgi:hypothetical protein
MLLPGKALKTPSCRIRRSSTKSHRGRGRSLARTIDGAETSISYALTSSWIPSPASQEKASSVDFNRNPLGTLYIDLRRAPHHLILACYNTFDAISVFYPFKYATHPRHRLPSRAAKPSGHAELPSRAAKPVCQADCQARLPP